MGQIHESPITVRPRGTRPHGTRTSLGHDFKKGSKIFEISDFGTKTLLGHDFKNFDTSSFNEYQTRSDKE